MTARRIRRRLIPRRDSAPFQCTSCRVCFQCVGFNPISSLQAAPGDVPLIPETVHAGTSGMIELRACRTALADGLPAPIGSERPQYLFGLHLQMVGPFGTTVAGSYAP